MAEEEENCRRAEAQQRAILEIHLSYMSVGDENGNTLANLVARERMIKAVLSRVVPRKSTEEWVRRRLMPLA